MSENLTPTEDELPAEKRRLRWNRFLKWSGIILGGLITQTKELEHIGLPLLGSIPGLGNLFKHVEEKLENKELVIFISPVVR